MQLNSQVQKILQLLSLLTLVAVCINWNVIHLYREYREINRFGACSCGVYAILTPSTNMSRITDLLYLIFRQKKSVRSTAVPRTIVVCRHFQLLSPRPLPVAINLAIGPAWWFRGFAPSTDSVGSLGGGGWRRRGSDRPGWHQPGDDTRMKYNLERTLETRRRKVGVVMRRQLKRSCTLESRGPWLKKVVSFLEQK